MSTVTQTTEHRDPATRWVFAGILSGIILAVGTLPIQEASAMRENGALLGMPTYLGGVIHDLIVVPVLLVVFAAIVSGTSLRQYTGRLRNVVALGIAYGLVLWVVYFGFIVPLWASAIGVEGIPFPYFDFELLLLQPIIGALIGGVYYFTLRWSRGRGSKAEMSDMKPGAS